MSLKDDEYDDYYDDYDDYGDDEYDNSEDYSQEGVIPVLRYTPDEIFALRVYESSVNQGFGPLSLNPEGAYRTINTLLFPGIDNEFARIFDDGYTALNARCN